jgi:hypothetical protein
MLAKASTLPKTVSRRRFLDASAEKLRVAPAARLAVVHRETVYRRMADPEFVTAMRTAAREFFRRCRERVGAEEAERRRWRQQRERSRRPMRCANLAKAHAALAAKRRRRSPALMTGDQRSGMAPFGARRTDADDDESQNDPERKGGQSGPG